MRSPGTASEPLIAFTTSEKGDAVRRRCASPLFARKSASQTPRGISKCASNRPSGTLFGKMTYFNPFASVPRRISSCGGRASSNNAFAATGSTISPRPQALERSIPSPRGVARPTAHHRGRLARRARLPYVPVAPRARRRAVARAPPHGPTLAPGTRVGAFARVAILTLAPRSHARLRPIDRSSAPSASTSAGITRRTN